jgi:CheY-like chemotaxis protein
MEPRVFGINAMVADMEPLLRRLVGDDVDLALSEAAGLWPVELVPGKLEEVFLALVVDGCEAMPAGGTLRITTANVSRPEGLPEGDYVLLSVSDTGRAVSDAVRAAIRGSGKGREGLGIRLAFQIAEAAGGHVDILPNGAEGTEVRLLLPRADRAPSPADLLEAAGLQTGSETVLIVEDEKSLASVAGRVLARLGYSVKTAYSAEGALKILAEPDAVHLLITDMMLPGMDGAALARQATQERPGLKVLFMSGYSEESLRLRGSVGPGAHLLEKPFTVEGLAARVRAALA